MSGRDIILAGAVVAIAAVYIEAARERRVRREIADIEVSVLGKMSKQIEHLNAWAHAMNNWAFGDRHERASEGASAEVRAA